MPRKLRRFLPRHEVVHAFEVGWGQLQNGELLGAAESAGFDLFVTCDKNIRYQQNLTERRIAIILLSTNYWPIMQRRVDDILKAIDTSAPSSYAEVECGRFTPRMKQ